MPDVDPVFLFDRSVVIFVIGSASRELDGLFSFGKMSLGVVVEKLTFIIAIEAEEENRECFF